MIRFFRCPTEAFNHENLERKQIEESGDYFFIMTEDDSDLIKLRNEFLHNMEDFFDYVIEISRKAIQKYHRDQRFLSAQSEHGLGIISYKISGKSVTINIDFKDSENGTSIDMEVNGVPMIIKVYNNNANAKMAYVHGNAYVAKSPQAINILKF